jgi:hypothetical protein
MEAMHGNYVGALFGVIGIGWLIVVPMYRGWSRLNKRMSDQVRRSADLIEECSTKFGTAFGRLSTIQ